LTVSYRAGSLSSGQRLVLNGDEAEPPETDVPQVMEKVPGRSEIDVARLAPRICRLSARAPDPGVCAAVVAQVADSEMAHFDRGLLRRELAAVAGDLPQGRVRFRLEAPFGVLNTMLPAIAGPGLLFREKDRSSMLKHFDVWSHSDVRAHHNAILDSAVLGPHARTAYPDRGRR
jgi:hypothetical protein